MFCFSGLIHEHQRPDRDDYVKIHSNNVMDQNQFNKFLYHPNSFGIYDPTSIMHYKTSQGSSDGTKKTITSKVNFIKIKNSPFFIMSARENVYRRSPHFVIFGTKRVSRNLGITNFETLFSTKP